MSTKQIDFLAKLVAAKSVSSKNEQLDCSNYEASCVVAAMLDDAGMKTQIIDVPDLDKKHNVIGHAGPVAPNKGLLLSGHTDTVPYNEELWDTDPLKLTRKDGKLYGMGACDMKQFFAVINGALAQIDITKLKAPLQVWATANEECGMEGANFISSTATPCQQAIVGEPTNLVPIYAHKGGMAERVTCHGKAAHASVPGNGANALEAMSRVITALRADNEELAKTNNNDIFNPSYATMNFGMMQSGNAFNTVPNLAELWVDRRLLPGENLKEVRKQIQQVATKAASEIDGVTIEFSPLVDGFGAVHTPVEAPIVQYAKQISGKEPTTVSFGTEAPYFFNAGMDVVVLGAGDVSVIHQPNEYVPIKQIEEMTKITVEMIKKLCY